MFQLAIRSEPGTLLFRDWLEAGALWRRVALPGLVALVLMPDHLHVVHAQDIRGPLAHALSGFIRWRNHARGESGPRIQTMEQPQWLADDQKVRRSIRYVHLNPCRARLVADPLEWPFSTHRDAVGLTVEPSVVVRTDAARFHAYVSSDPTVRVDGTPLPMRVGGPPVPEDVMAAVSAAMRAPIRPDGRFLDASARRLYLSVANELCAAPDTRIAACVAASRWSVARHRASELTDRAVRRIIGDPRFPALFIEDLRRTTAWRRYADWP